MSKENQEIRGEIDPKAIVRKSNSLVLQNYKLTEREGKILDVLISKIEETDTEFNSHTFKIKDLCSFLELAPDGAYTQLKGITLGLVNKGFQYKEETEERSVTKQTGFLSDAVYNDGDGSVKLCFSDTMKEFLLQLKRYISYTLEKRALVRGGNNFRLYEILRVHSFKRTVTYSIEELKKKMGLLSKYKQTRDFRLNVIDKAQDELSIKTDLSFTYKLIKTGRKITHIKFNITDSFAERIRNKKLVCVSPEHYRDLLDYGVIESKIIALDREGLLTADRIERNLAYCNEYAKNHTLKKGFGGLLASALKEDWGKKSKYQLEQEEKEAQTQKDNQERERLKREHERKEADLKAKYNEEIQLRFDSFVSKNDVPTFIEEMKKHGNKALKDKLHKVPAGQDPFSESLTKILCRSYFTKNHLGPEFASFEVWADHFHGFTVKKP